MGWFGSKKEEKKADSVSELPELPDLPELPQLSESDSEDNERNFQLPSFPSNSLGEKFSQNAIKEAVSGGKRGGRYADDGDFNLPQMTQTPIKKKFTERYEEIPEEFAEASERIKKTEPVFIRIDKFEEALKIFEETRRKIGEIEKMLTDLKRIKEKEEGELNSWEEQIKEAKEQIYKIDQEVFSKIE